MSTQAIVPDKLRALLALANSGIPQTTDPTMTRTIAPVPTPAFAPPSMTRLPIFGPDSRKLTSTAVPNPPGAADLSAIQSPAPTMQPLPAPNVRLDPQVAATQARTLGDMNRLQYLTNSGSGVQQITHPVDANGNPTGQKPSLLRRFGGVLARIGDTAESIVAPGVAALTPGTTLHHDLLLNQQAGRVNNDLSNEQQEAQTNLLDATPELKQMAAENAFLRTQGYLQHVNDQGARYDQQTDAQLALHGYKRNAQGAIVPMSYQELSPTLQSVEDLKQSQSELADANKAYAEAKAKNLPLQMQMAERRIQIAQQNAQTAIRNLQLRGAEYNMHAFGTDANGNALPGVLYDATGQPIGSNQAANVRPTSQERRVGDLAQSAVNQVRVMRQIVKDHPEVFGPVAGRTMTAEQWLGSQSPDAQNFLSASRYLADHSAGVFGSRSVEITKSLEQLTQPNTNPAALNAALDRAESTAQHFVDVGTVRTHPPKLQAQTFTDGGVTYHIPADKVAAFKKDHPNAR